MPPASAAVENWYRVSSALLPGPDSALPSLSSVMMTELLELRSEVF